MTLTLETIFEKAQLGPVVHNKLLKKCEKLYDETRQDHFRNNFLRCLKHTVVTGDKAQAVNILDFVGKFCGLLESRSKQQPEDNIDEAANCVVNEDEEDEEPMNPFVAYILGELLKLHSCKNQVWRLRVCYCIRKILQCLGPEASIDSDICDEIYGAMLERLKDKSATVRAQAVSALERLQDPSDPGCPVVKAFLFHMSMDPSAEVRRAVLLCLGRSKQSLPYIRNRIQDVKDSVRKEAYLSLSKVTVKSHSIKNRELLLSQGLKDRSDAVRSTVEKVLLPNWLENCQGEFKEFLHVLDVANSEIAELALKVLLKQPSTESLVKSLPLDSGKCIPPENLTVELSFLWRCIAEFLQSQDDGLWELVLPELSTYCGYIRRYLEKVKGLNKLANMEPWDHCPSDFIIMQLVQLMKVFDLGDETGRENSKQLLLDMLISSDTRLKVIPAIMDVLVKVVPDVDTRLSLVTEIISEIHDPLLDEDDNEMSAENRQELDFKIAQLRLQRNILEDEMEVAIHERRFLAAEELKINLAGINKEFEELEIQQQNTNKPVKNSLLETTVDRVAAMNRQNDPGIVSKCLSIVYEMMQSPTVKSFSPQLRSLMDNFVKNSLQVQHAVVQVLALQCLAVFSLFDESIAKEVLVIFCIYLGSNCSEIAQVAVKGIFDLLLKYGLKTFSLEEEDEEEEDSDKHVTPKKRVKKNLKRLSTIHEDSHVNSDDETVEDECSEQVPVKNYNLLSLLTKHLDSSQGQLLCNVVEGLCKLLYSTRISSPKLLSRLILLWFNPTHDGDHQLKQVLGLFFKTYATSCRLSQETLEQCFLPTITTVQNAPSSSPLSHVDELVVAKFLLGLTKPGVNMLTPEVNIHNNLALKVCNGILNEYGPFILDWINILCQMDVVLDEKIQSELFGLISKIRKECPDRASINAINKFESILKTGVRASGSVENNESVSLSPDLSSIPSLSTKRSSSLSFAPNTNRNKALRTESDSMIPSDVELLGVIPDTSDSGEDSVFE